MAGLHILLLLDPSQHLVITGNHRWRYCKAKRPLRFSRLSQAQIRSLQQRPEGFANETACPDLAGQKAAIELWRAVMLSYWCYYTILLVKLIAVQGEFLRE